MRGVALSEIVKAFALKSIFEHIVNLWYKKRHKSGNRVNNVQHKPSREKQEKPYISSALGHIREKLSFFCVCLCKSACRRHTQKDKVSHRKKVAEQKSRHGSPCYALENAVYRYSHHSESVYYQRRGQHIP